MPSKNPLREVPPDQFVQARNALARQLRERGDAEGARKVAALRRPSTVLWIVNQLGSRAPEAVEDLIASTRRAGRAQMQAASGDELREAMRQQKEATQRLLAEAGQSTAGAGLALTLEQQRRMQDTLQTAASAEPDALRAGTLEHELSAAGFNALLSGAAEVRAKAASRKRTFTARIDEQKKRAADALERQVRERELKHAQQAAHRLTARATQLEKIAQRAEAAAEQARTRAEAARREADASEAQLLELRART